MAAFTTPSVSAPEMEQSNMGLNEPSMEDILASIRRIIAEDHSNSIGKSGMGGLARRTTASSAAPVTEATPAHSDADDFVSEPAPESVPAEAAAADPSGDMLRGSYEPDPVVPAHDGTDEVKAEALASDEASAPMPSVYAAPDIKEAEPPFAPIEEAPLISPATGASISSSFHALAESVLFQDPAMIERLTRDELRPMLKTWLDDNLPGIVERLVRNEIERVARGGRRD